jgi:hypothetical protein
MMLQCESAIPRSPQDPQSPANSGQAHPPRHVMLRRLPPTPRLGPPVFAVALFAGRRAARNSSSAATEMSHCLLRNVIHRKMSGVTTDKSMACATFTKCL